MGYLVLRRSLSRVMLCALISVGCEGSAEPKSRPSSAALERQSLASSSKPALALRAKSAEPTLLVEDPLWPTRPAGRPSSPTIWRDDDKLAARQGRHAAWPRSRPKKEHQYSRTNIERGRVLPCEAAEPGFGVHRGWHHVQPSGHFIAPRHGILDDKGRFDLVVHFHGHRPARKEFVRSGEDLVLLGVSLGIGAAYGPPFSEPKRFLKMVRGVEAELSRRESKEARVRRIALSAWSRGYEAIPKILKQPLGKRVDALILVDSLHASRDRRHGPAGLDVFRRFAKRAEAGRAFFFMSHSSIDPPNYASTTETAHYLLATLGQQPEPMMRRDPLGLELFEGASLGNFHVRGYAGNGKLDHCAQFGVYPAVVRALAKYWMG